MQSQIIREIVEIDQNNHIHLDIELPKEFEQKVEIIIVPLQKNNEQLEDSSQYMAELQMQSSFAKKELSDPAEDVWNEYL
jgi:hypothetical protein